MNIAGPESGGAEWRAIRARLVKRALARGEAVTTSGDFEDEGDELALRIAAENEAAREAAREGYVYGVQFYLHGDVLEWSDGVGAD